MPRKGITQQRHPSGAVLVIVRNSRGVQVSDHNVQRNTFSVRVAAVSVWAGQLE
jgi:hypothetical protein